MSTAQFKHLFDSTSKGLFFLQNHLADATTPYRLEAIIDELSKVYDQYREKHRQVFSPVFRILDQNNSTRVRIVIEKPDGTVVGNVDLYPAQDDGIPGFSLALLNNSWDSVKKSRHRGIQLSTLSRHIRTVARYLDDTKAWSLRYQMAMLERLTVERPKTVSFDLDVSQHGVSVTAYVKGNLFSSIFVAA
jgi:hypothetical protein